MVMGCKVTARKSHYPKEAPFEVPKGWVWCRVDDIGDIVTGMTPSKSVANYYGNDYPLYKPTDLEQGINTITSSDALSPDGFKESRQIPCNSILVTCIGATIGKTGIIRREGSCNQQINAIIPHNAIVPEYLYTCCISDYFQEEIHHRASATTLPILNKSKFSEIPIPVPPINEQHRILEQLSHYIDDITSIEEQDGAIERNVQQCKNKILDLAIHGILVPQDCSEERAIEILRRLNPGFTPSHNLHYEGELPAGWQLCHIQDIAKVELGKTLDKAKNKGEEKPYLCALNVKWGSFDLSTLKKIRIEEKEKSRSRLQPCDLLVCEGGDVGRCAIWQGDYEMYYQNALHRVRFKQGFSPDFYLFVLRYYKSSGIIDDICKGVTIKHFTGQVFNSLDLPVPPLNEQKRIVGTVKSLFEILDLITNKINAS